MNFDEIFGFAKACDAFASEMSDTFYKSMLEKSSEIIIKLANDLQKEMIEGEEGKRDIPPAPPIERKGEEGEAKKDSLSSAPAREGACSRVRVCSCAHACACTCEYAKDGLCTFSKDGAETHRLNQEADVIFADFWSKYPTGRKVAKKKTREKFRSLYRIAKDKAKFINQLFEGLDKWITSHDWCDGYVCNPYTFLNQERWLDKPKQSSFMASEDKARIDEENRAASAKALKELGL